MRELETSNWRWEQLIAPINPSDDTRGNSHRRRCESNSRRGIKQDTSRGPGQLALSAHYLRLTLSFWDSRVAAQRLSSPPLHTRSITSAELWISIGELGAGARRGALREPRFPVSRARILFPPALKAAGLHDHADRRLTVRSVDDLVQHRRRAWLPSRCQILACTFPHSRSPKGVLYLFCPDSFPIPILNSFPPLVHHQSLIFHLVKDSYFQCFWIPFGAVSSATGFCLAAPNIGCGEPSFLRACYSRGPLLPTRTSNRPQQPLAVCLSPASLPGWVYSDPQMPRRFS